MKTNLTEILPNVGNYDMTNIFDIYKYGWDIEILKIEKTYEYVEELVNRRREWCSKGVHTDPGSIESMGLLEELGLATSLIQPTYYKSVFVTIYSTLEATLKNLVFTIEQKADITKSLEELRRHNGVRKFINFLVHNGVEVSLIKDKNWEELLKWQDVRNCISHNGGIPRDDHVKQNIEQIGFIIDQESPEIMFHHFDVERFIELVKAFMDNVYNLCKETFEVSL